MNFLTYINFVLIFTSLNVNFAFGQIPSIGGVCPSKVSSKQIDMRELTGQWYEVEASPLFAEWLFKCISIKVSSFFAEQSQIKIEAISDYSESSDLQTILSLNASFSHMTNGKDGKLNVSIVPGSNVTSFEVEKYISNIQVLDTDYSNWAILWTCRSYNQANARAELVWILSRQRTLDSAHYRSVQNSLISHNLEGITRLETIQSGGGCTKSDDDNENIENLDNDLV